MSTQIKEKISLRPLGDRVLLKRLDPVKQTGGIILPDTAQEKQSKATVLAVGPGKSGKDGKMTPMHVAIGDVVLLDKYAGQNVKIDGEEYIIANSDDLIAIIN